MAPNTDTTTEIFAIWEYDSYERYKEIESNVRSDIEHVQRVNKWYENNSGRDFVYMEYVIEVKNEQLFSTLGVTNGH
ncbi:pyridine nucleotide-disulfide oxidoreductase [Cohnella luojiensis]|uniref:Pyridine nucleotide-disulfide oxidoreductase n=1 Tax=Cohnella luojiensis TaxID=652876 RepID=A0A4Y8LPF5_9BACL|nr:pyridine nucleotide-disulfide oxidoreductase [Cohnella luojiensis]